MPGRPSTNIEDEDDLTETEPVARLKIHHSQLTLEELRRAIHIAADDYVDAEAVERGILLKPSAEARRQAAPERIHRARAGVRYIGPEPRPSPEEEERMIADLLAAEKAAKQSGG